LKWCNWGKRADVRSEGTEWIKHLNKWMARKLFIFAVNHVKAEQARIVEEERQSLLGAWMSRIMRWFVCV